MNTRPKHEPLAALTDAYKAIDATRDEAFDSYFIGALSTYVEPEDWASALATATKCVLDMRERMEAP